MIRRLVLPLFVVALPLRGQSADLAAGIGHYNARRWPEAHATFATLTKAQPKNADAAVWLGRTLMAEDKPGDAEDWFDKASRLQPGCSDCQLWLARAIGLQAQRANVLRQPFLARRMKAAVDRAIVLEPDNVDARELRWQFYRQAPAIMGGGADKARDEASEIMRRNRYRGQFIALNMASRAKDDAGVERTLKALVAEFPDSVGPVSSYASWLADKTRTGEAFALVDAFQKRRPGDAMALFQVGRLAAVTGQQLDRGEEALRRYLTMAPAPGNGVPTPSNTHFRLGNIREKRGDTAGARAEYEAALRLDGRNDQARKALGALK